MHARHIGLGAEVLQVEPDAGWGVLPQHHLVTVGQLAAKGFDDHIGKVTRGSERPGQDLHLRMPCGRHPGQCRGIVDPEPDAHPQRTQRARQAPAHPKITMVVDDLAKNIPAQLQRGGFKG